MKNVLGLNKHNENSNATAFGLKHGVVWNKPLIEAVLGKGATKDFKIYKRFRDAFASKGGLTVANKRNPKSSQWDGFVMASQVPLAIKVLQDL